MQRYDTKPVREKARVPAREKQMAEVARRDDLGLNTAIAFVDSS